MLAFMSAAGAQLKPSASGLPAHCALFQAGYRVFLLWLLFKTPPPHTAESTAVTVTCDLLKSINGRLLGSA